MKRLRELFLLFYSMLKIGLFTFGGGYAMIHLLNNEFVTRRKWMGSDEFMDLVVIAESTPGPIAINCATYIGYKKSGFLGALFSTLGMCIPSFSIIYVISLYFDRFLEISWVGSAFRGIQVCVVFLILSAGLKMLKKIKKTRFNIIVMSLTFFSMITLSLFSVEFSSIYFVLIFGGAGLFIYTVGYIRRKGEGE